MAPDPREWSWSAHPARERPLAAALALLTVIALSAAAGLFYGHPAASLPAALLLLLSLNRFLLPSRFRIDGQGIHGRYPLGRASLAWDQVRRTAQDARGIWLSSRARPSRLDAFGGMHVLFGGRREEVTARIRAWLRDAATS